MMMRELFDNFGLEEIMTNMNTQNMHLVIWYNIRNKERVYAVHVNCENDH